MNIKAKINAIKKTASRRGIELTVDENDFIDADHLDCTWYGGNIAHICYKDLDIDIDVFGDVIFEGTYNGQKIYYVNTTNTGAAESEFIRQIPNDFILHALCGRKDNDDRLICRSVNCPEARIYSKLTGKYIDSKKLESENILDAIEEVVVGIDYFFDQYSPLGKLGKSDRSGSEDEKNFEITFCYESALYTMRFTAKSMADAQKSFENIENMFFDGVDFSEWNIVGIRELI